MKRCLSFLLCLCLLCAAGTAAAAMRYGQPQPEDFAYRGLALGDDVAKMREVFGEENFDRDKNVYDTHVKYYTYDKVVIGVEADTGRVEEIIVKDRDFRVRNDVRRGATPYLIFSTYGKSERRFMDGVTCYIYENPQNPQQRLILALDADGRNSLEEIRLTSLPLNEEEAMRRKPSEEWQGNTLDDYALRNKDIDMSALPQDKRSGNGRLRINYHYDINKGA